MKTSEELDELYRTNSNIRRQYDELSVTLIALVIPRLRKLYEVTEDPSLKGILDAIDICIEEGKQTNAKQEN
jgi:hypothetical protein